MFITPLDGKLIAEPLEEQEIKTESGIVIPGQPGKARFIKGKVIACASAKYVGDHLIPMTIKAGDIIYFDEYTTREFTYKTKKYYCLEEDKAYGILKEEE